MLNILINLVIFFIGSGILILSFQSYKDMDSKLKRAEKAKKLKLIKWDFILGVLTLIVSFIGIVKSYIPTIEILHFTLSGVVILTSAIYAFKYRCKA